MSFNLDDPLAGILSDGSDDSFFDDDILGKKKPAKKKTTPVFEKKNALFDLGDGDKPKTGDLAERKDSLFDLGILDNKKAPTVPDDKVAKVEVAKSPGSLRKTFSKESVKIAEPKTKPNTEKYDVTKSSDKSKVSASSDKINSLGDFLEPKKDYPKSLERGKSSQSLLDDILGGPSSKTSVLGTSKLPSAAAKSQELDIHSILGKNEPNKIVASSVGKNVSQKPKEMPKEEPKKQKPPSDDWLGIFQNRGFDDVEDDKAEMPAWLVGDSKKNKPAEIKQTVKEVKETVKESVKETKEDRNDAGDTKLNIEPQADLNFDKFRVPTPAASILKTGNEDLAAEGAALYFQEQESQLMVAMQLKAQEEKLAAMQLRQKETQRVQREAAHAHHAQLDAILQRQTAQRQQMQAIISAHQERISQRIKDLLTTSSKSEDENVATDADDNNYRSPDKVESPHVKEKKQLLQLVQSLQENHDKEIDLMETSYRRQLAFLEVSVTQSEERMKEESDKLLKFYAEKITWLEEHHQLYRKMTEENLSSLTEKHNVENEMLRQQHLENIRVLQEHHVALMENVKNAVKQEHALIKESAGFSSDLNELVNDVKESKSHCRQLVEKVQAMSESTRQDMERSLLTREAQVQDMIQQLKKERENFDSEKTESRELVKMLETRLKQMTTMIEEENGVLKQKKMEFEFEKATFTKQTEFAKNVLKKQDDELKTLREDIQREYKEKIARIEEERAKAIKDSATVAKEKASIQNLRQELEKTKAELNAQLEEVTEERSKLNMEKQQLHMEEQRILAKSRDLDLLARTAVEKQTQADKRYSEAEFIQRKYEDRIRRIQEHVVSLNAREKQIAKEKVALSRERLSIHNERKQLENKQCSFCKCNQSYTAYNNDHAYTVPDTYLPVTRDYGGNVNCTMSAIEQDLSHLMGRNFSLRHNVDSGHHERFNDRNDKAMGEDVLPSQSIPIDSGAFKELSMDPKFMMLRLDVQQVLSNLESRKEDAENVDEVSDSQQ